MLNLMLNKFKKALLILLMGMILVSSIGWNNHSYANECGDMDIVIRCGEYANDMIAKPGKRQYIDNTTYNKIKDQIKVREDERGRYVSEADINKKLGTAIASKLGHKGVKVLLQVSTEKKEDLNASGRFASEFHPDIYFSVHHNYYKPDSSGYFFIVNNKDIASEKLAQQLNESIKDNPLHVPQMKNRYNEDNYIGEMNVMGKTDALVVLGEFGFFGSEELVKIVDDEQIEFIAERVSNELIKTLESINREELG